MAKRTTSKSKTAAERRVQLARDLAAVLANPELPNDLLDGIRHGMNDIFNGLRTERQNAVECSETYLKNLLDQYADAEAEGEEQD